MLGISCRQETVYHFCPELGMKLSRYHLPEMQIIWSASVEGFIQPLNLPGILLVRLQEAEHKLLSPPTYFQVGLFALAAHARIRQYCLHLCSMQP